MNQLVVIGAGGFGREVIDVIDAINAQQQTKTWDLLGVLDDSPSEPNLERLETRGIPYLGSIDQLGEHIGSRFVVGIGNPSTRAALVEKCLAVGGRPCEPLVHPSASMGFDVRIGEGSVLCAGVRLTTNIRIGNHVHLNLNCTVGHDVVIGDFVSVNPLGSISGDCNIQSKTLIGVSGVVLNGVSVGAGATVGGSACVVKDVEAGETVVGVPAKPLKRTSDR